MPSVDEPLLETRDTTSLVGRSVGFVVLVYLAWQVAARGVTYSQSGLVLTILDGTNFIFHEAGHVLFALFGSFIAALGGSLNQVAIPLMCTGYFVWKRQPAAAAATLFWAGESLTHVAVYVADARARALPLHGGDGVIHDWHYLLGELRLLDYAEGFGRLVFALGMLAILSALGLLGLDIWGRLNQRRA
jgi:hypothetical protein